MRKFVIALALALALHGNAHASAVPVGQIIKTPVAIANGGTTSAAISTSGASLVGIQFPAALTSTVVTFTASSDGVTFAPLYNSTGLVSYTVAPSRFMVINAADFYGPLYFKIVLGSSEGAARSLTAILKGI